MDFLHQSYRSLELDVVCYFIFLNKKQGFIRGRDYEVSFVNSIVFI